MRKRFLLLLVAGLVIFNSGCVKKIKDNYVSNQKLKESLQRILDKHLATYQTEFPGKDIGFGLYVKSAGGYAKGGSLGSYPNEYVSSGFPKEYGANIQFRAGSNTKTFTAAGILKLDQEGKLNIDDLITANIPGTNEPYIPATSEYAIPYKDRITIRLLLQHRAGVFDVTNDIIPDTVNAPYAGQKYVDYTLAKEGNDHTFTIPELVNIVAVNHFSYFEPGDSFHYSNTGFHMLAVIIERVSGKRYGQFMQDEFATPLHLNHTSFPYLGTDQSIPDPHVSGWLKQNGELTEWDKKNISFIVGDGNAITTPDDLVRWTNDLYGTNTILNADLQKQMVTGIPTHETEHVLYGLGTEMNPPDIGYGHNGAHPAYMTIIRYHPETNASYVLTCNFMDLDNFSAEGNDMFDIIREAIQAVKDSK